MKKFPSKVMRSSEPGHGVVLTEEQEKWLRRYFPTNENVHLAAAMGISVCTLRRLSALYGLKKSKQGLILMKQRQVAAMVQSNISNGCYDRKRGHKVSEATMAGTRRRWAEEHAGLRENCFKRIQREDPEHYEEICRHNAEAHKELFRKETRRMLYGLERKTKLRTIVIRPYTQSQAHRRCSALKRGYILSTECSEGSPDRYVIFYDNETERSPKFESNCINDGFIFKAL